MPTPIAATDTASAGVLPSAVDASKLSIQKALAAIREHLGMDVAYLSEFVDGQAVFRAVDAPGLEGLISPGDARDLDDIYCRHILDGRLPELIPDTSAEPIAQALAITAAAPIGAHMSLPVRLPDGEVYGMFCCLSASPNPSLNARDLATMRMFADLAAEQVADQVLTDREAAEVRRRILLALEEGGFAIVAQPIEDMASGRVTGFECLSRFTSEPYRPPNVWFDEAARVDLGEDLELAAIRLALEALPDLPDEIYLSVNASPETIMGERLAALLSAWDPSRIMLEVTEHAQVADYASLRAALAPLREKGAKLAVDDAGAGYASLAHILQLSPDVIKLDMSLVRDVDTDPARRSLASAMIHFAKAMDIVVVAEGIETQGERATLLDLGAERGQGYFLGRPAPIADAASAAASAPKAKAA